jgi:hypothetical protein
VYISDEYGPSVYRFSPDGRRLATFAVPEKFRVAFPSSDTGTERAINASGRWPGKAMVGLAITPDGRYLLAAMQAPLIQDGGDGTRYTRMVLFDTADPAARPRELLYKLEADPRFPGQNISPTGVSDVVAINDHQFLVDERDASANVSKRAFVIDIDGAQDIGGIASLNALTPGQVNAIVEVNKAATPLFDLIEATGGLPGDLPFGYQTGFPDKVEGFAFGPDLPDGRRLLLVTNDDDFAPSTGNFGYPNYVMAFAVDPADVPGFVAQQFAAPETFATEPGGPWVAGLMAATALGRGRRRASGSPRGRATSMTNGRAAL